VADRNVSKSMSTSRRSGMNDASIVWTMVDAGHRDHQVTAFLGSDRTPRLATQHPDVRCKFVRACRGSCGRAVEMTWHKQFGVKPPPAAYG
jgi:hypothetical protein